MEKDKTLIFFNTPIHSSEEDVLGIGTYISKLNAAIDAKSQMIAITSPFGAGKTSAIELLEATRDARKKEKKSSQLETIIRVSMWSQLNKKGDNATIDLHRAFLYQLASQINHRKGTYISRRLSSNYGLLKINTNEVHYWVLTVIALIFAVICWGINAFPVVTKNLLPFISNNIPAITTVLLFLFIVLGLLVVTKADILFSSNKSEGGRIIGADEIIDYIELKY